MKLRWFVVLVVLALTAFLPLASAHNTSKLNPGGVYRVGVEDVAFHPYFAFTDSDDQGLLKAVMDAFADHSGLKFTFIPLPISRFDTWYQQDRIDFRLPDNHNWQRSTEQKLVFSQPITRLSSTTVVLAKNRAIPLAGFATLGTVTGFTPSVHWQHQLEQGKVQIRTDASTGILYRMLMLNMVDGLDLPLPVVRHQGTKLGDAPEKVVHAEQIPIGATAYTLSTEAFPEVIDLFDQFLREHRPLVEALHQRYGIEP